MKTKKNIRNSTESKKKENQINKEMNKSVQTVDSGRSMTEMLGTLAVMGVLAVAGVTGYKFAMEKYEANKIANEMNLVSNDIALIMNRQRDDEYLLSIGEPYDTGYLKTADYDFDFDCGAPWTSTGICSPTETRFFQEIAGVPKHICREVLKMTQHLPYLVDQQVNGQRDVTGSRCFEGNNTLVLAFDLNDTSVGIDPEQTNIAYSTARPPYTGSTIAYTTTTRPPYTGSTIAYTTTTLPPFTGSTTTRIISTYSRECIANDDCVSKPDTPLCYSGLCKPCYYANTSKPYWDATSMKCTSCYEANAQKPYWNTSTKQCEPCPTNKPIFNSTTKTCIACYTNSDCKSDEYCHAAYSKSCTTENQYINNSTCQKATAKTSSKAPGYAAASGGMSWWNANRFCSRMKDLGYVSHGRLLAFSDFKCADNITGNGQYCHETKVGHANQVNGNVSSVIKNLHAAFPHIPWAWTSSRIDNCGRAYNFSLSNGYLYWDSANNYVICK